MGSLKENVSGTWIDIKQTWENVGGTWTKHKAVWENVGGTWTKIWTAFTSHLFLKETYNSSVSYTKRDIDGNVVNNTTQGSPSSVNHMSANSNADVFASTGTYLYKLSPDLQTIVWQKTATTNYSFKSAYPTPDAQDKIISKMSLSYASPYYIVGVVASTGGTSYSVGTGYSEHHFNDLIAVDNSSYFYTVASYFGESVDHDYLQKRNISTGSVVWSVRDTTNFGYIDGHFIDKQGKLYVISNGYLREINTSNGSVIRSVSIGLSSIYGFRSIIDGNDIIHIPTSTGYIKSIKLSDFSTVTASTQIHTGNFVMTVDHESNRYSVCSTDGKLKKYNSSGTFIWEKAVVGVGNSFASTPGIVGTFPDKFNQ